jgi:hypothetical protein
MSAFEKQMNRIAAAILARAVSDLAPAARKRPGKKK